MHQLRSCRYRVEALGPDRLDVVVGIANVGPAQGGPGRYLCQYLVSHKSDSSWFTGNCWEPVYLTVGFFR